MLNVEIESFCQKNDIFHSTTYKLMLLFEELCLQILLPRLAEPRIRWTAEYAPAGERIMVRLEYNGPLFDIRESDNALSLKLIQSIADIMEFVQGEDEALPNRVLLNVRNTYS